MSHIKILRTAMCLMLAAMTVAPAFAKQLTPQEALNRIRRHGLVKLAGNAASASYDLNFTGAEDGQTAFYVFNKDNNGFVITSADDRLPAVIGYSDNGAFDYVSAPPAMQWLLGEYAKEAAAYLKSEGSVSVISPRMESTSASRTTISPLVATQWNQSSPYNDKCPMVGSTRCVTGCVATAMAQIINYHEYAKGTGVASYTWNGQTLSYDFGNATFDFSSATNNAAVAELMLACGISVEMAYGTGTSGASDALVSDALVRYFGYDPGIKNLERIYFSAQEWDELIYGELEAGRPVLYGGQAPKGGHEFVCDGYKDGLFHINWGWGGYQDGYFMLSDLTPSEQGTGGYEGGYNTSQTATVGIQPPTGSSARWYPVYMNGDLSLSQYGFVTLEVSIDGLLFSRSRDNLELEIVAKLEAADGSVTYSARGSSLNFSSMSGGRYYGYNRFSIPEPTVTENGIYKVSLAIKTPEGGYQDILAPRIAKSYCYLTVKNGSITYSDGEALDDAKIVVKSFYIDENPVIKNQEAKTRIGVENVGEVEYNGRVTMNIYAHGSKNAVMGMNLNTTLAPGASTSPNSYYPITYDLDNGQYDVVFYDLHGRKSSNTFTLVIGSVTTAPTAISIGDQELTLAEGETKTLTVNITPTSATDKTVTWTSSDESVATVDQSGIVTAVKEGTATITATTSNRLTAETTVTVTAASVPGPLPEPSGLAGDFNNNGKYDIQDVTILVDYILRDEKSPEIVTLGDLNGSHTLDVGDVTKLVELILHSEK